jgi:AcrR family transcriptional regulator
VPAKPTRAARLAPEVRRDQLIAVAVHQFAEQGYTAARLQDIAAEVGVTRNLIHRYFPGGKRELYVEAVRLACRELSEMLDTSPEVPLPAKTLANIATYLDAILDRAPRYLLYASAERSADDEVRDLALETRSALVARMALNNLGTENPPGPVAAALNGFISFTETTTETWLELGIDDRAALEELLRAVFVAIVAAARKA